MPLGGAGDDVEDGAPPFVAGGDVEEHQLVGAGRVIGLGLFDGIAGVHEVHELHALHHPAVLDVQAGDDADPESHAATPSASAGSMAPL